MLTRDALTSGTVTVSVTPAETFVLARRLLGDDYADSYTYRITRVENAHGAPTLFLSVLTERRSGSPSFVYVGIVHPLKGSIRLTTKSAFPSTAKRVRIADRVLQSLFAGRADAITGAGWSVEANVEVELPHRF